MLAGPLDQNGSAAHVLRSWRPIGLQSSFSVVVGLEEAPIEVRREPALTALNSIEGAVAGGAGVDDVQLVPALHHHQRGGCLLPIETWVLVASTIHEDDLDRLCHSRTRHLTGKETFRLRCTLNFQSGHLARKATGKPRSHDVAPPMSPERSPGRFVSRQTAQRHVP